MNKIIAVTQRIINNESYFEIRDALDIKWGQFFEQAQLIPILLPSTFNNFELYFSNFHIDGILLTGGNDLYRLKADTLNRQRDDFEKRLLNFAMTQTVPVLGVCHGAQLIADYFQSEFKSVASHTSTRHSLNVHEDSSYKKLLYNIKDVNSFHNYSISNVSPEMRVSASSDDGVIEAVEHKRLRILGIMWHPERENTFRSEEILLFRHFF